MVSDGKWSEMAVNGLECDRGKGRELEASCTLDFHCFRKRVDKHAILVWSTRPTKCWGNTLQSGCYKLKVDRVSMHFDCIQEAFSVFGVIFSKIHFLKTCVNIFYAVNKKGVSCRKQGVSWTKIAFLFKCS